MKIITDWLRAQSKAALVAISVVMVLNLVLLGLSIYYCTLFFNTLHTLRADHSVEAQTDATIYSTTQEITTHPNDHSAYHQRARLFMREEKYDEAVRDLTKVLELNPGDMDAYIDRSFLYDQLKNPDLAKQDREKVKELFTKKSP